MQCIQNHVNGTVKLHRDQLKGITTLSASRLHPRVVSPAVFEMHLEPDPTDGIYQLQGCFDVSGDKKNTGTRGL